MDLTEVNKVLELCVDKLRLQSFSELSTIMRSNNPETSEVISESGCRYYLEVFSFIENKKKKHLRVVVTVFFDNKKSMSDDFIITSDGFFIGE